MKIQRATQALDSERRGRAYQGVLSMKELDDLADLPESGWLLGKAKVEQIKSVVGKMQSAFPDRNVSFGIIREGNTIALTPTVPDATSDDKLRIHSAFTSSGWDISTSRGDADTPRPDTYTLRIFKTVR